MKDFSLIEASRIFARGINNYAINKPLCVSFEVTLSCNANCRHCDRGGIIGGEERLGPEGYAQLYSLLNSPVIQISGGEPLLREDVTEIIRALKQSNGLPYVVFVTNAFLLNEGNYLELKAAGVDQFSISLDFPDERHDEFRRLPGLYAHLQETIPRLADLGYNDIVLNSAITRNNLRCLPRLAKKAEEWNVAISYSAYTILRTGHKDHFIYSREDLKILRQSINDLVQKKRENRRIVTSEFILRKTYEFFKNGFIPNCRAGKRFLVVMPDGYLNPCAQRRTKYMTQRQMLEEFSKHNNCGECYVSIRSYTDQSLWNLLKGTMSSVLYSS